MFYFAWYDLSGKCFVVKAGTLRFAHHDRPGKIFVVKDVFKVEYYDRDGTFKRTPYLPLQIGFT